MNHFATYDSPLGLLTIASDGESLTGLWLEGQKYFMAGVDAPPAVATATNDTDAAGSKSSKSGERARQTAEQMSDLPLFAQTRDWLACYFLGQDPGPPPPVNPPGSDFSQQVWQLLRQIPYGKLATYGELAKKLAASRGLEKMSARAVGSAVGHNPIAIIVPCHRVIGSRGNLTGFAGGIPRKIELLKLEGIDTSKLR